MERWLTSEDRSKQLTATASVVSPGVELRLKCVPQISCDRNLVPGEAILRNETRAWGWGGCVMSGLIHPYSYELMGYCGNGFAVMVISLGDWPLL